MNSPEQNQKVRKKLVENYTVMEEQIVNQLKFSSQHHVTTGTFREEIWKSMFEQMIPQKFSIEHSVFIIDSDGHVSNEVDLAIFDEQYTPYIFRYGKLKYIPIEAVAVVVQCKSKNIYDDTNLEDWVNSIKQLQTKMKSISRTLGAVVCTGFESVPVVQPLQQADKNQESEDPCEKKKKSPTPTQTSTRPIRILCHTETAIGKTEDVDFDILIHPSKEEGKLEITIPNETESLGWWHGELNYYGDERSDEYMQNVSFSAKHTKLEEYRVISDENPSDEVSLLSLTFQLNQLLMLINNPILFPHLAYVQMFQKTLQE
ncbi:DUF6602 domain-containing protein [Paenibacillus sp. GCM10012306]|uniref:DUF6602 domain-containing protein n=1 Tax=Paenibacillus sp. GCM10012306 TaxID=3317342 RepID=UPI00361F99F3